MRLAFLLRLPELHQPADSMTLFFSIDSSESGGADISIFSLPLLYELPTSLLRRARLALLPAETGRVRVGIAAERDQVRSADENVFVLLETLG